MREFHTQDGTIVHLPDTRQRAVDDFSYVCDCHRNLGNDFWFLPTGSCMRPDKRCNHVPKE